MTATRTVRPQTSSVEIPATPLTIEGYSVLHQMFRFKWQAWRSLRPTQKAEIADEAAQLLKNWEASASGQSALFSLLGHKGDLMLVHFRESFDQLNQAEMQLSHLRLSDYLEPATSYLSVIELGLYESSLKTYRELTQGGVEPHSDEWKQAINETLVRQREAMRPRLYPEIPQNKYICFYPMDRRRGEDRNWYTLPIEERARQMNEHGLVGRR
jgi:peroxiredoxin